MAGARILMPLFIDALWQRCQEAAELTSISLNLCGQFPARLYLHPSWPVDDIRNALALNLSSDSTGGWAVYGLTTDNFDIHPHLSSFARDQHGKLALNEPQIHAFYDALNKIFRIYDTQQKRAAIIYPTHHIFAEWDAHSPLREFFHLWALSHHAMLIHCGIVSLNGNAALLPGAGGSGKSTTVVSCLHHHMQTTGDDYNIIMHNGSGYRAYPLYANLKLKNAAPKLFDLPLITTWKNKPLPYAEKTIYYPQNDAAIWDKTCPRITKILCPTIPSSAKKLPETYSIKAAELIQKLAISSIMQSPIMAREYLAAAVKLASIVPYEALTLSEDPAANAALIQICLSETGMRQCG